MIAMRKLSVAAATIGLFAAAPASAQFYFKAPNIDSPRLTGAEPGILAQPLPGASADELRAALVWNLRAALNVAALQCQFAPTLLTLPNYNTIIKDHAVELNSSYATLTKYFVRTHKTAREGQTALDQYGTRVYTSFSAVHAQLTFCAAAHDASQQAVFAGRGKFGDVAAERLGEIRNSLSRWGEQQFSRTQYSAYVGLPLFADEKCWRRDIYTPSRCSRN